MGLKVSEYVRTSDGLRRGGWLGAVRGGLSTPWNPFAAGSVRRLLRQERPDILHVHNCFPLLSPAVFHAARGLKTATVLTLHNYRLFCAAGIPLRGNAPCTACLEKRSTLDALKYGCYRKSRLATVPLAAMIGLHRRIGTWEHHVDAFIALTEFQRELMIRAGLPGERVFVKPHFYADAPDPVRWQDRELKAVFIGRVAGEKGVSLLVEAWREWGGSAPKLEIIGDGPDRGKLENSVAGTALAARISFAGQLPFDETQRRLGGARLLVVPSVWFEGFPMVIREAFALGVPVAGSRLGSIVCVIRDGSDGVLFAAGDAGALGTAVRSVWDEPGRLEGMARAARKSFEQRYTPEINGDQLAAIYRAAIARRRSVTVSSRL
ncbi:MAG: glycosyltransferase [Acidobacteriota bacterium]